MTELIERLQAGLADRYRVDRELGQGGMATVYLAHDLKLKRDVAIKVLRPELALALGADRFLREIETTASLRHPNILPVFDSGRIEPVSAAPILYYVMPYLTGESLRQRLDREGQLQLDDAVAIARQVAEALGAAHDAGVVHRDIKPANILLERGHAVVADFGIARAVAAAGGERLTETGLAIGTPSYMSPEQSLGENVIDGRSDFYSLGCVLYEMLAGEAPFIGNTAQAIITKRLTTPSPEVTTLRPTVPPVLARTVRRMLERSPADRPTTAEELIAGLTLEPGVETAGSGRRSRLAWYAALGIALLVAIPLVRWALGDTAAARPPVVAVLPFQNAGAPTEQYFADGLTDEVATRLSRVAGLAVLPVTAARLGDDSLPPSVIGERLGADYLLAGRVQWDPTTADSTRRIRISSRLVRARDGQQVWASSLDAKLRDVFSLQEQIAGRVAEALGITLGTGERSALARRPTADVAAYDRVLQGNFLLAKRTPDAIEAAMVEFEAALAADPGYADALAKIGYGYALFKDWGWRFRGRSPAELRALALDYSNRALAADSTSAAAWLTRAYVLTQEDPYRLQGAVPAFERALALDSATAEGWYQFGQALMILGRDSGATAAYRRAFRLDPNRPMALMSLAAMYRKGGQIDRARLVIDSAVMASRTVTSPYVRVMRGIVALEAGDRRLARDEAELALALDTAYSVPARSLSIRVLVADGDTVRALEEIEKLLAGLDTTAPPPNAVLYAAGALLAVGRDSQAISLIERARPRGAQLWFYLRNPEFNRLKGTPRFDAVVADADPNGIGSTSNR